MDKYKVSSFGCYACPISCGAIIKQQDGPFAIKDQMHRPEQQTLAALGGMLMNDNLEAVIKANDICNRYGIDTMGVGGTIAMAMECYERGLISREDTDGIELTWGNAEAIVAMVEKVAKREGFGALLADGSQKAAERIGKGCGKVCRRDTGKKPGVPRSADVPGSGHCQYRGCQSGAPHGQSDHGNDHRRRCDRFRSGASGVQDESICSVCHRQRIPPAAERRRIMFVVYRSDDPASHRRID